jgi:hypothetical protein
VIVLLLTGGFRYLTMGDGIPNDHFVHISGGWQMLSGEWPTRDWVDPGTPLMFVSSALSQLLLGQTLVAEAVLVAVTFALGAALTAAVVHTATGSLGLALLATVLEVAIVPRTYSYPKVLVYALGFLCFVRYVERPGMGRLVSMAAAIVVGFLFRHDHGLFLAVGGWSISTSSATRWRPGCRTPSCRVSCWVPGCCSGRGVLPLGARSGQHSRGHRPGRSHQRVGPPAAADAQRDLDVARDRREYPHAFTCE